jgi:hypothetical protein
MTSPGILRRAVTAAALIAAAGSIVSTQGQLLPSAPRKAFGASISPAFEGWFDNADGSHTFLIGYYSRNWEADVDIPIGPDNHFTPGEADRGQPTHFMPRRNFGMFTVTVPKNTPVTDKLWWVLTVNGVTQRVPFYMSPDYNITPHTASEESPGGVYNKPPILRFAANGTAIQSPIANVANATRRTAVAGVPMTLDVFVEDDALYASGSNAPIGQAPRIVEIIANKYRGPGTVTLAPGLEKVTALNGGKPAEPYAGKASTTVTFSQAGDYLLHVTVNDLSGKGGGATGCCWTTSLIKVAVQPASLTH